METVTITVNDGINGDYKTTIECPEHYDESIITAEDIKWDGDIRVTDRDYLTADEE